MQPFTLNRVEKVMRGITNNITLIDLNTPTNINTHNTVIQMVGIYTPTSIS